MHVANRLDLRVRCWCTLVEQKGHAAHLYIDSCGSNRTKTRNSRWIQTVEWVECVRKIVLDTSFFFFSTCAHGACLLNTAGETQPQEWLDFFLLTSTSLWSCGGWVREFVCVSQASSKLSFHGLSPGNPDKYRRGWFKKKLNKTQPRAQGPVYDVFKPETNLTPVLSLSWPSVFSAFTSQNCTCKSRRSSGGGLCFGTRREISLKISKPVVLLLSGEV